MSVGENMKIILRNVFENRGSLSSFFAKSTFPRELGRSEWLIEAE